MLHFEILHIILTFSMVAGIHFVMLLIDLDIILTVIN